MKIYTEVRAKTRCKTKAIKVGEGLAPDCYRPARSVRRAGQDNETDESRAIGNVESAWSVNNL